MHIAGRYANRASRFVLHTYANVDGWTRAVTSMIVDTISDELTRQPRAQLMVCGGRTTPRVYNALSTIPIQWNRIDVSLIDERWWPQDETQTNSWLVHDSLLRDCAREATFVPLLRRGYSIEQAVALANASAQPPCVGVLSMGDDGHIASLFPEMAALTQICASHDLYAAIDATDCQGARGWTQRISVTPHGLRQIPHRLLLLQGRRKREILEQSLTTGDSQRWPALFALSEDGPPLHVHWCE